MSEKIAETEFVLFQLSETSLAKFSHFGNFLKVYLIFGKIVNLVWQLFYAIGQKVIVVTGQIL